MDKFYIITNNDKDKDFQITNEIVSYLKKNGKKCQVQQAERKLEGAYHYTNPELIPEGTQCILDVYKRQDRGRSAKQQEGRLE